MTKNRFDIMNRRTVLKGIGSTALAAPTIWIKNAWSQDKVVQVGSGPGPQTDFVQQKVKANFERDFGCRVVLNQGTTLDLLARLRAQKSDPRLDVAFVDDLAVQIARGEDLITRLPVGRMSNVGRLRPEFVFEDGFGVAILASIGGMFYNSRLGPAPRSFAELWEPKYQKKITLSSIRITSGVYIVIAAAAVATGKSLNDAQYLPDEGFRHLEKIVPNVLNVHTGSAQGVSYVAQGEAAVGAFSYSRFVYPFAEKGAPIEMAYGSEGAFPGINCQVLVKNGPNQELGIEFLNRMIDPTVQRELAEFTGGAPAIRGLDLPAELKKRVIYDDAEQARLKVMMPDWKYLNQARGEWTNRWNRIFTT